MITVVDNMLLLTIIDTLMVGGALAAVGVAAFFLEGLALKLMGRFFGGR